MLSIIFAEHTTFTQFSAHCCDRHMLHAYVTGFARRGLRFAFPKAAFWGVSDVHDRAGR